MPNYTTQDIHNVALVGQTGSGKTSLVEAILHDAGVIPQMGSVEKKNTVCDFEPEEQEHHHSLNSTVVSFDYSSRHLNLIDTPGYPDLYGHALAVLPAVETVGVVINAQSGIETVTRRIMEQAKARNLCRFIVVNRIDVETADLPALIERIREAFGNTCLPINLPANGASSVVDCFFNPSGDADFSSVADAHTQIIDQVVEVDEELMAVYLEQGELSPDQLHEPFEKALRDGHLIPICFTSSKTGAGVRELLDLIVKLMPNPAEGNPRPFLRGEGDDATEFHATPDPSLHSLAHVFKVTSDPFVGKLSVFRVHQGTVRKDSQLFIGDARKPMKAGHLFKLFGKERVEVDQAVPGDIAAVAKVEDLHRDSVLHDSHEEDHIHLLPLEFSKPMTGLALTAKSRGDQQKLSTALHRLLEEEPCFEVEHDDVNGDTIIRGLGDLHLRTVLERIKNHFHVEVETKPPRINYRETITGPAEGHCRHKKQTGGAGQFGEVYLRIEPNERGGGIDIANDTFGGSIPSQFIPAIEKGIHEAVIEGVIAGHPLMDVRVSIYDGKFHSVDSKEVAFITAGKKAFIDAVRKANPVLLEPIVTIDIALPEEAMGDISGDLSNRRGRISGTDMLGSGMVSIRGEVPLAEITTFQSQLKSITAGQGSYALEFSRFDPVPPHVQDEIVRDHGKGHD